MHSPEDSNELEQLTQVKDSRLFDSNGNIREDVIESREEEAEEVLSLEVLANKIRILEHQTKQAMEQVDATFTQVGTEMNQLTHQVRTAISDMHVRLGTLEEINMNPTLADDRKAIQDGIFTLERFKEIAKEIVLPDMKIKAETAHKKMQAKFDRMQQAIQDGMSPEEAVKIMQQEEEKTLKHNPNGDDDSGIKIVSG